MRRATFEPIPASAYSARRFVRDCLVATGATADLDVAVLLVSELATNAIVHARSEFDVWVDLTGPCVRMGVDDRSDVLPSPTQADPDATRGRGLAMIEVASDRWGVERTYEGKTTWLEIGAPLPAP
jgi:hypothetical protein